MTKNQISTLAQKSFVRNELDPKRVKLFASKMKRRELRKYIRTIKSIYSKNKVTVIVPSLERFKKSDVPALSKTYRGKKIIYEEDPQLLVGVRLIDNDLIYDFNLKNSLENIMESYD